MIERLDKWPRVHTCLYDWCPQKSDECKKCDEVVELFRNSTPAPRSPQKIVEGKS